MKQRFTDTYQRSNVIGNDEMAQKEKTGGLHNPTLNRKNAKWESTVFAGPIQNTVNRKVLAKGDAGKNGLYGDTVGSETWTKKESLAGAMS